MRIYVITPAKPGSRAGNRVTARRWAKIFRELGHQAVIEQGYHGQACDVLVALHARRSFQSVKRFHELWPDHPLVLALTGTDLYHDIHYNQNAQQSIRWASHLVLLQPHGIAELPDAAQDKAHVIFQSVEKPKRPAKPLKRVFEIAVVGHLRPVKDPMRTALAARRLPASSRIRIIHIGRALSDGLRRKARNEMMRNPRYRWLGELPRWKSLQRLARSRLMVVTSKMEGAPNVASEALAAGTPILSSKISGMTGLLGGDHPGYFPVGDTRRLAELMSRAERDDTFYRSLQLSGRRARALVDPRRERSSWRKLLGGCVQP